MTSFAIEHSPASMSSLPVSNRPSPTAVLRRCRQPVPARIAMDASHRPLRVTSDRRGFAGGAVLSCAGPWRTSGAWWEDEHTSQNLEVRGQNSKRVPDEKRREDGPWSRDEWDVALADGAVYRIFRDRTTDGWFIDGVID